MCFRIPPGLSRVWLAFLTAGWLSLPILAAAPVQPGPAPEPLSQQQKDDLTAATTPEKLLELGKGYVLQRTFPAAAAAVEKVVRLKPELLADPKPQSPKSWNDFWFTQRALLAVQKLAKNDAAGRVKLAKWLSDAGQMTAATQMLTDALAINKELPEAKELAKLLNLGAGGPLRFDLTYGASQPLVVPTMQDQSTEISLRPNNVFVIIPFAYNATDPKLNITKPMPPPTADGKACQVRGIALLESSEIAASGSNTAGKTIELKWPAASEPLWERLQVQQKADKSGYELVCYNTTPPIAKPPPRTPGAPAAPRERNVPGAGRGAGASGTASHIKDIRPANGYAAFVLEAPQTAQKLTIEYRGAEPLTVETAFLQALAGFTKETAASQREQALSTLLSASSAKEGPIAAAAMAKLAMLRSGGGQPGQPAESLTTAAMIHMIDIALVAGLGHPDGQARQAAFDAIFVKGTSIPEPLLNLIKTSPQPGPLLAMLEGIRLALAQRPTPEAGQPAVAAASPTNPALAPVLEPLPTSGAPATLFAGAAACLAHSDAGVRQKAVELLVADGTRESVEALSRATGPAREAIAAAMTSVTSNELKAALVRVLLMKTDPASGAKLLAAAGPLRLIITREDDPLLTALNTQSSPQATQMLLELLARADLTAVSGSDRFRQSLETLAGTQQKEAGVRKALLVLAMDQFKRLPYEAPVKRERQGNPAARTGTAFEGILANLATGGGDDETARVATATLVRAGRISLLAERFAQAQPKRKQDLAQALLRDKDLWAHEALPIFLAGRISDQDPQVQQKAVATLTTMQKRMDPKLRWLFNLGVKSGLDWHQMLDQSLAADSGEATTDLLISLASLPASDAGEFKSSSEKSVREEKLSSAEQKRQTKPSGPYMAMVYVDLKPFETPAGTPAPAAPASTEPALPPVARLSMPLQGGNANLLPAGNTSRVIVEGNDVSVTPPGGAANPSGPTTMRINAGLILRAVFSSPEATKEGVSESVDLTPLNEPRECDLKYEQFGTWSCEVTVPEGSSPVDGRSLKLIGAKIVLEPLPPK